MENFAILHVWRYVKEKELTMKFFAKKLTKPSAARAGKVVANFSDATFERFEGFNYSVAEGLALSKRSYTEIPGLTVTGTSVQKKGSMPFKA